MYVENLWAGHNEIGQPAYGEAAHYEDDDLKKKKYRNLKNEFEFFNISTKFVNNFIYIYAMTMLILNNNNKRSRILRFSLQTWVGIPSAVYKSDL